MRSRTPLIYLLLLAAACTTSKSSADDSAKAAAADTAKGTTAESDDNAGRDAIGTLRSTWKDDADRKDSAGIAALYADDAILVTSAAPVANGRAEIEKTLGRLVNSTKTTSIDSKELFVRGDEAYDYGTFSQEATAPNGKTITMNGYYIVTAHRQGDGSWKITRHLSVTPPAKP